MKPRAPLTVLVVDDEQRSLETLRRTLEEDFTVLTASSAEEGEVVMGREFVHVPQQRGGARLDLPRWMRKLQGVSPAAPGTATLV